jgi:hypothetical protein
MEHHDTAGWQRASRSWTVLIAAGRAAVKYVTRAAAHDRAYRLAVERELFGGLYIYSSKNDDALPAVGPLPQMNRKAH